MVTSFNDHLSSYEDLVTPYEKTRAGFISLALEKNRRATPFIEEAKALKAIASNCKKPMDLLACSDIRPSILAASGISDKASNHLTEENKDEAIKGLIENFLEPAGEGFVEELVYRFLLTRGDSLGGSMRNVGGVLGERRLSRSLISTLSIEGRDYFWLHSKSKKWIKATSNDPDIELYMKGISWEHGGENRTLIYNLTVPLVRKNVDLCLFNAERNLFNSSKQSCHHLPSSYLALGELKGGIDPAGADEHWKTANSALERIRKGFSSEGMEPATFFVGAAIEKAMASEIYNQLNSGVMANAANLTNEKQVVSVCKWLIHI